MASITLGHGLSGVKIEGEVLGVEPVANQVELQDTAAQEFPYIKEDVLVSELPRVLNELFDWTASRQELTVGQRLEVGHIYEWCPEVGRWILATGEGRLYAISTSTTTLAFQGLVRYSKAKMGEHLTVGNCGKTIGVGVAPGIALIDTLRAYLA